MRRVLIGAFLGLFFLGVPSFKAQAGEQKHTKDYLEWREKTTNSLNISSRHIKTENNVKKLADAVKAKYGKSQKNEISSLLEYIEWLHKALIILERDNGASGLAGTKLSDIPGVSYSNDEPTRWFVEELLKAMALLDELAYVADKIPRDVENISSAKLNNVRFLHVTVRNLQNGGDLIKALQEVDAFQEKLKQKQ